MIGKITYLQNLRYVREPLLVVPKLDPEDVRGCDSRILLCALVITSQVLGHLLVIVEHNVRHTVFAYDRVRPELLHEEDLVGKVGRGSCSGREGGGRREIC